MALPQKPMNNQNQDEIKLLDLGEAALLLSLGYKFLRLDPSSKPRQRVFIFGRIAPEAVGPYYTDPWNLVMDYRYHEIKESVKLVWDPYQFYMATKELKDRIHDDWELGE